MFRVFEFWERLVLPDGPTARGAGVSRLFNLFGEMICLGPPVGRVYFFGLREGL
jgi:hypothetical protein